MKRLISVLIALCVSLNVTVAIATEPAKLPTKEKFQLYLLIGQSNMAGRGVIEAPDKVPHPRVLMFTKAQAWAPALDPLHFDKPIAGVGLGSTFGRVMVDADPSITVGLIPCAVGGTPLGRWEKDQDLYKQAVVRTKAALADGTLRGILWHQGEGDSGKQETAESYAKRLSQMVVDLRAELSAGEVPFVAGELGQFLVRERNGVPSFWPTVNEQINQLPKLVPKTAVAPSQGLTARQDQVHFDTPALREFGKRYAAAMQKLQAGDTVK